MESKQGRAAVDIISLAVYSFTFLLGLPSNLLVLAVYLRKARKRGATPCVVYALNLCVANLALVAWLPVMALETAARGWALPLPVCLAYSFFLVASLYGSCLFLAVTAVGRYLGAAYPISYKLYRSGRLSCGVSAGLWALVLLHLGPGLAAEGGAYFTHPAPLGNGSTCFQDFTAEQHRVLLPLRLEMALLLFLLPLAATAFCTLRCVALVRRSCLPAGRKRRAAAVACATLAVFVVCYGPYNASHVVGFAAGGTVGWRKEAMLTSACNVFLEPAVMLLLSPPNRLPGLAGRLCGRAGHGKTVANRH
ncbi:free fatty acid receptor 1 [Anguilla anguilla]|uniref:free fatty acid receptor 1 n=1 Tax=Anguilla anguilla TaxID=7936 RepID=UPI0015A9A4E0|nr:free fatty acid receptor 1 [Anguilla anguilla]